jgi:hypothetical protein
MRDKTGSGFKQLMENRTNSAETALLLLEVILEEKVESSLPGAGRTSSMR